jgi:hypothetical protein
MKGTMIMAIFALVAAVGAAGIVTAVSSGIAAHASQFGSCHQLVNGAAHLNGVPQKTAAAHLNGVPQKTAT